MHIQLYPSCFIENENSNHYVLYEANLLCTGQKKKISKPYFNKSQAMPFLSTLTDSPLWLL